MSKEVWKPVVGHEGLYEVSSIGRVKRVERYAPYRDGFRIKREKILSPNVINGGYQQVLLTKNMVRRGHLVHRLVANAFIDNPDGLPQVNHKDGNKKNNTVSNLEWCTAKENMLHSVVNGMRNDCKSVGMYTVDGNLLQTFKSIGEAERKTGIFSQNISCVCKGQAKTAGGYVWKIIELGVKSRGCA